jgi:hypothetical protein
MVINKSNSSKIGSYTTP